MLDESELPIPATMAKTDQRRGGEGSTQEARKEILEAEPTELSDPSPGMEAPPEESLTCGEAGLGNRHQGGQSAVSLPSAAKSLESGTRASAVGMGREATDGGAAPPSRHQPEEAKLT